MGVYDVGDFLVGLLSSLGYVVPGICLQLLFLLGWLLVSVALLCGGCFWFQVFWGVYSVGMFFSKTTLRGCVLKPSFY